MDNKSAKKRAESSKETDELELLDMDEIGRRKKRKKTTFDYIRYGIMAVALVVFIVAGYNLYSIFSEYSKGEEAYDDVAKNFTNTDNEKEDTVVSGNVIGIDGFVRTNVDFDGLQNLNPDIKGWIQFEGISDINYPILQHKSDNNYYLTKMYNNEENTAGSIFMDVSNTSNFQDYGIFIYGHNMKNLSMFGHLKEYKNQGNYAGKDFFWIYTPTANYHYQIFSCYETKVDSGMFKIFQTGGEEYTQYVAAAKAASLYDTGVEVTGEDKIVTLSTCTNRGDQWRFLVQAKLVGVETKQSAMVQGTTGQAVSE